MNNFGRDNKQGIMQTVNC